MPSSSAIKSLHVAIGVDMPDKDVKNAETALGSLTDLAVGLAAAFAASKLITGLNNIINKTAELGDNIAKAAIRTGLSAEALKQWNFVAGLAGVETKTLENSFFILARNMDNAIQGSKMSADAFKDLGLNVRELQNMSPEEALLKSADAFTKIENANKRSALAMKVFGKSGAQLIPLFLNGTAAIEDQIKEAKELGITFSEDAVKGTQQYIDNQLRLETVMTVLEETIGNILIPVMNELMEGFVEWWKVNKDLIRQPMAKIFNGMGRAIKFVGKALKPVTTMFDLFLKLNKKLSSWPVILIAIALSTGAIVVGFNLIIKTAGIASAAMKLFSAAAVKAFLATKLAAIASAWATFIAWAAAIGPLWLVIGAIGIVVALFVVLFLILQDLWVQFNDGESAIDKLTDKIVDFGEDVASVFRDVYDEIKELFDFINEWWAESFVGKSIMKVMGFAGEVFDDLGKGSAMGQYLSEKEASRGISVDPNFDPANIGVTMAQSPGQVANHRNTQNNSANNFQPQTTLNMTVNASPGMSVEDVGNAAARASKEELDRTLRETFYGMTPAAEGA